MAGTNLEELEQRVRKLEKELIESKDREKRYRLIVDHAVAPIVNLTPAGDIQVINQAAAANMGGVPDNFIGKTIYEIYPEMADTTRQRIRRVMESGTSNEYEDWLELPSGKGWFLTNLQPVKDANGAIIAVQMISSDITERKQADKALKESEEKYRTLFENAAFPITYWDTKGRNLMANRMAADRLRLKADDMLGKDLYELFPDMADFIAQRFQKIIESGKGAEFQDTMELPTGTYCFWSDIQPVKDTNGNIFAVQIVSQDHTDRMQAQEAQRESEEKFRAIIETINELIWEVNAEGCYTYVSPRVRDILGYEQEELMGKTPFDFMPPGEAERADFHGPVHAP